MSSTSILSDLRDQPFYAGQIYRVHEVEGAPASASTVDEAMKRLGEVMRRQVSDVAAGGGQPNIQQVETVLRCAGFTYLYEHQELALRSLLLGKDVILSTPEGSGRTSILAAASVCRVLQDRVNVLFLMPVAENADSLADHLGAMITRMGLDHACAVTRLGKSSEESLLPEILVATPVELMRSFEGSLPNPVSEGFLVAIELIVLGNIEFYTGTFGRHVSKLLKWLVTAKERAQSGRMAFAVTGERSGNLVRFAGDLIGRPLSPNALISGNAAGIRRKTMVFWTPPLVRQQNGDAYQRKDFHRDALDLIRFLTNYGLSNHGLPESRRFSILVDRSGSMATDGLFSRLGELVSEDLQQMLSLGDELRLHFFDFSLGQPICTIRNGDQDHLDAGQKVRVAFSSEQPSENTSIGNALKTLLLWSEEPAKDKGLRRQFIVIYTDGQDQIQQADAMEIQHALDRLRRGKGMAIDLVCVSFGLEPEPSVRHLIEGLGGRVVNEVRQVSALLKPSVLVAKAEEEGRPVVVLCEDGSLIRGDLADVQNPRRELHVRSRWTHPDWENLRGDCPQPAGWVNVARARFLVISGWRGSASRLNQFLACAGQDDALVFVLSPVEPSAHVLFRLWDSITSRNPMDVLMLGPDTGEIGLNALACLTRTRPLTEEDALQLLPVSTLPRGQSRMTGGSIDGIDEGHHLIKLVAKRHPWLDLDATHQLTSRKERYPLDRMPTQLVHVARRAVAITTDRGEATGRFIDILDTLYGFAHKITMVINGIRYVPKLEDQCMQLDLGGTDLSTHVWLDAKLTVKRREGDPGGDQDFKTLKLQTVTVEADFEVTELRAYPGGRYDHPPGVTTNLPKVAVSFTTTGIRISPSQLPADHDVREAILCGLENLIWSCLDPLVIGVHRPILALADIAGGYVTIFPLEDGPTDLPNLLLGNHYEILDDVLRRGLRAMLDCPCEETSRIVAENERRRTGSGTPPSASSSHDGGCPFCLESVTKPVGLASSLARKRLLIEFLGRSGFWPDGTWEKRLREKYDGMDDGKRLTSGEFTGQGMHGEVVRIMAES